MQCGRFTTNIFGVEKVLIFIREKVRIILKIIQPYLETVIDFLSSHNNSLRVCDLGCGDFNIGKHLFKYTQKYIAVDIVDALINRNKTLFKAG